VTVFEKNDRIGGLLRYGIPDFKMEKSHIDRRVEQMQAEGVSSARRAGRQARRREDRRLQPGVDRRRAADWRSSTRWCWPAAPRCRATCRCPAAN
jgi:hypothetical protein